MDSLSNCLILDKRAPTNIENNEKIKNLIYVGNLAKIKERIKSKEMIQINKLFCMTCKDISWFSITDLAVM